MQAISAHVARAGRHRSSLTSRRRLCLHWVIGALACCAIFSFAARAVASERVDVRLEWVAPVSCPDRDAVHARIAHLLPKGEAVATGITVRGTIVQAKGRYSLLLTLMDGELKESRRYEAGSCEEVVGAAAVAIALLMQAPRSEQVTASVTPDSSRTPQVGHESERRAPAATQNHSPRARRWKWVVVAPSLVGNVMQLSRPQLGLGGGIGFEVERWWALVSGAWFLPTTIESVDFADSAAQFTHFNVSLHACHWFLSGRFELAPCLGMSLEQMLVQGEGPQVTPQKARATWLSLGPALAGRWMLARWAYLRAQVGVGVPTARPRFMIDGQGEVEQVGALNLAATLAAEWIF